MDIIDLLTPEGVIRDLEATSKKHTLQDFAARAAAVCEIDERHIFDVLLERERLGSTGIGDGVAIPHGKLPELGHLFALFARLDTPVDFDAADGVPVDLLFLLLAPESAGADHLKALTKVSRYLRDREVCARLRDAPDPDAILTERAAPHAA
jgi:PTS system nitrogen regulatory IIA component